MKKRKLVSTEIKEKHALYNDGNNLVDRISDLPDELLCHILSFLPIKHAFPTTLLSKRWIPLCYSLPVLIFKDETTEDYDAFQRFCGFVNTLMLSPLATNKPIRTLSLNCNFRHRDVDTHMTLDTWLEAAKRRCVVNLSVSLNYHTLKPIIFISQTLVVLKLLWLKIASDTSCVDLPSLKILHLEEVCFKNRNDYINFLSACPILEDFHAEPIYIHSEKNRDENNVPDEGFKSLTLSKLVRVSIGSVDAPFNGIGNVKNLRIITRFTDEEASFKAIPVFSNLIYINLLFFCSSFHCWDGVVELLSNCPMLKNLYITKWTKSSSSKDWKCPISVLKCVSSRLRICTILNFDGSANDLRFATYILQNATLLRDMNIGVATNGLLLEKGQFVEELFSCPRISPRCKISFEFKDGY